MMSRCFDFLELIPDQAERCTRGFELVLCAGEIRRASVTVAEYFPSG